MIGLWVWTNQPSPNARFRVEQHGSPVGAVLWLLHEQEPVEQLYRVVLVEDAVIDQLRVLTAGPTT